MEIDGSLLEGGGQILRVSAALSAITGTPVHISSIRAGRPKPGLAAQHLAGLKLVEQLSGGHLENAQVGSQSLSFIPGPRRPLQSRYMQNCDTAGSITLMVQIALPVMAMLESSDVVQVDLTGGTNVSTSPPFDHMRYVFFPLLERFSIAATCSLGRRGYYPMGGGKVSIRVGVSVDKLTPIQLTVQGQILRLCGVVCGNFSSGEMSSVVTTLQNLVAEHPITSQDGASLSRVELVDVASSERQAGKRSRSSFVYSLCVQLWVETDTGCRLSSNANIQKRSSGDCPAVFSSIEVAEMFSSCLEKLQRLQSSGACVDEYTADSLLVYMALADGSSEVLVEPERADSSLHIVTAIAMAEKLTSARFEICSIENPQPRNEAISDSSRTKLNNSGSEIEPKSGLLRLIRCCGCSQSRSLK